MNGHRRIKAVDKQCRPQSPPAWTKAAVARGSAKPTAASRL